MVKKKARVGYGEQDAGLVPGVIQVPVGREGVPAVSPSVTLMVLGVQPGA